MKLYGMNENVTRGMKVIIRKTDHTLRGPVDFLQLF